MSKSKVEKGMCVNGCRKPICPPSKVICKDCMDGITKKLEDICRRQSQLDVDDMENDDERFPKGNKESNPEPLYYKREPDPQLPKRDSGCDMCEEFMKKFHAHMKDFNERMKKLESKN